MAESAAEVKAEAPEPCEQTVDPSDATPSRPSKLRPRRNLRPSPTDETIDEAATLAELWPSRKAKPDAVTPSVKIRKTREKKDSSLKSPRKRRNSSAPKPAVYLRSGKKLRSASPSVTKTATWLKAEEFQSSLNPNIPSFIKGLVRSHVGGCFFVGFPGPFCKAHLPYVDTSLIVEDEYGKQYEVKYIGQKGGLSAGWRQFSLDHCLLMGDVLVVQLVEATKLKVHIIRKENSGEAEDTARLLLTYTDSPSVDTPIVDTPAENPGTDNPQADSVTPRAGPGRRRRPKSLPLSILQKKKKKPRQKRQKSLAPEMGLSAQLSGNDSEVRSEVLESTKQMVPKVQFKDVTSFENFKILIDGVLLDPEIPEDTRHKYYELCCSQNEFLHDNLMEGINLKLVAGIVSEIVRMSDAIRACDPATTQDKFSAWDRTLEAFELFGVKVGFLRKRVERLTILAFESGSATEAKKLAEAKSKRTFVEDEMRKLELRLVELEESKEKLCAEIDSLQPKVETYERQFLEVVNTPW